MLNLDNADDKFKTSFVVIENGAGKFTGIIDEISQTQVPAYVFSAPRRLLRIDKKLPVNTSMVIQTMGGTVFLVGNHGDSELTEGTVFRSFRLFQATARFHWERRGDTTDLVTGLQTDFQPYDMNPAHIWGSYEPTPEQFDRETHVSVETARFITNQLVSPADLIDGKDVIRVDKQLGLFIVSLS